MELLVLLKEKGEENKKVLVDENMELNIGKGRRRRVDVKESVIRIEIIIDEVGEGEKKKVLEIKEIEEIGLEKKIEMLEERVEMMMGDVMEGKKKMLIKRNWI